MNCVRCKLFHRVLFSLIAGFALVCSTCLSAEIYVALDGNDQNPGTSSALRDAATCTRFARQMKKPARTAFDRAPRRDILSGSDFGAASGRFRHGGRSGGLSSGPGRNVVISGGRRLDLKWADYAKSRRQIGLAA